MITSTRSPSGIAPGGMLSITLEAGGASVAPRESTSARIACRMCASASRSAVGAPGECALVPLAEAASANALPEADGGTLLLGAWLWLSTGEHVVHESASPSGNELSARTRASSSLSS